jgi:hypothetical protein
MRRFESYRGRQRISGRNRAETTRLATQRMKVNERRKRAKQTASPSQRLAPGGEVAMTNQVGWYATSKPPTRDGRAAVGHRLADFEMAARQDPLPCHPGVMRSISAAVMIFRGGDIAQL